MQDIPVKMNIIRDFDEDTAATGQRILYVTVRDGVEATLPCNSLIDDQQNCDSTEWFFSDSRRTAVVLVKDGQIDEAAKAKSDRLSVSENCSLVIKKVTDEEDGGRYDCRQFISGQQEGEDALVYLSVVTMTEQKNNDEVMLRCSVLTHGQCRHTVKWLLQGQVVDKDNKDFKTSQSFCSASLTFLTSHLIYTSRFNSLKCEVTRGDIVQQFSFRNSPSGDDTTTATTESTPTEDDTKATNTTTISAISDSWWRFISVSVGLAALIITVVAVNIRARIKEKKTQMDQIAVRYDGEDDTVNYENVRPPDGV
ncbi:uncharacterized protein [Cebidichthys violaceus]|uniref:uncharacterized protein n=1 Tax=Cebidichthys violaceus TaxID=271503 RepID=UPI0035CAD6B5